MRYRLTGGTLERLNILHRNNCDFVLVNKNCVHAGFAALLEAKKMQSTSL